MDVNIAQHTYVEFVEKIQDPISSSRMQRSPAALMVVQLHGVNQINATHGYRVSHLLHAEVATWLAKNLRDNDSITSLADNKFGIFLNNVRNEGHAILAATKIANITSTLFAIDGHHLAISVSTGIALLSRNDLEADTLLQNAEVALGHAIKNGKSYMLHSPDMDKKIAAEMDMLSELKAALDKEEFEVVYQPKIRTIDHQPCGAEALLRWNSESYGPVSPEIFIPLIEQNPYIFRVTDFVLNRALRAQSQWPSNSGSLPVAVNIPPIIIRQLETQTFIEQALSIWGNDPSCLTLEISETSIMENPELSSRILNAIKGKGVSISIDDFGTGYSSLAYFKTIPANEVKIDKSFVLTMLSDESNYKLVQAIINLAHNFGHTVVAEGVETQDTFDVLKDLGCDCIQGYLVSEPLSQADFINWLKI